MNKIDVELNSVMRIIIGTLRSTLVPWLSVLSNITAYFNKEAAVNEWLKYKENTDLPIHEDVDTTDHLKSRKPAHKTTTKLIHKNFGNLFLHSWIPDSS